MNSLVYMKQFVRTHPRPQKKNLGGRQIRSGIVMSVEMEYVSSKKKHSGDAVYHTVTYTVTCSNIGVTL